MYYSFNLPAYKMARSKGDLKMALRLMTANRLARMINQCDKNASVNIVIGNIPQAIPIESLAIRQDGDGNEIITLIINHEVFVSAIDNSVKMIKEKHKESNNHEQIRDFKL